MPSDRHKQHLRASDVIAIRTSAEPYDAIAARFSISKSTVIQIRRGVTWRNVVPPKATVPTKIPRLTCERCKKTFLRPNKKGIDRRFCNVCRGPRNLELHRLSALRNKLEPLVRKLVREVLAEMEIPALGNGALPERGEVRTARALPGGER